MDARELIWTLFIGALAVLAVASAIGFALSRRYRDSSAVANFNSRTLAWWVMVVLLALSFLAGKNGVIALFFLLSGVALYEFLILTANRKSDGRAIAAAFLLVLPLQYILVWSEWYGLFTVFIPVYGFLLLPIIAVTRGETAGFMGRVAELQWGVMIAVFCLSHVPALMVIHIPGFEGRNVLLIAYLLLVVQSSDVLQYVWGKLAGRHKIAPSLSPSKTVEGFLGGVASASLLGAALWWITPFSMLQSAAIALVINLMGFAGGLVMSAIKRDRGVKDWGYIVKGHGGVLDRLDSIVFSAPVFFHLTRYWWSV
ncbi:phosphatidate cytidylyltransferase [Aestuariivirga sp.]|uniref:phosphatidate cytidylyltransferase n=1 Tax=Aestuariivirga sp. TaxID=2650926 RepID=UPI0039195C8D